MKLNGIWLMLFACATAAEAQTFKVSRIDVWLEGSACGEPKNVYIVLNDRDDLELIAKGSGNFWWWEGPLSIDVPKYAHASLRFTDGLTSTGRRTGCRKPIGWEPEAPLNRTQSGPTTVKEKFYFTKCEIGTVNVTMTMETDPPESRVSVGYRRDIPQKEGDTGGAPCKEADVFSSNEPKQFTSFWPSEEKLTLSLSNPARRAEAKELPVTKLVKVHVGEKEKHIPRDKVAFIWNVENAKGRAAAPTLSSTMNQLNAEMLGTLHFKSLKLTVE